jgi:GR25 family glycosyltransferase involved in LPS biosynthesis
MESKYQVVIINCPDNIRRKESMIDRMNYHKLSDFVNIISADDNNDDFRNFIKGVEDKCDNRQIRVMGSLLCHLKAMKYFIEESQCDECLIMEDDVMLHKDFRSKLNELIQNKPSEHQCILLAPYLIHPLDTTQQVTPLLFNHYVTSIFGASCYWITKDFAKRALDRYYKPLREWPDFAEHYTSEYVIHYLGSYVAFPPLSIEESLDSNLQPQCHIPYKRAYWKRYGFGNYF